MAGLIEKKTWYLQIHPGDNVFVALEDLPAGKQIAIGGDFFRLQENIPAKHKFTTSTLVVGSGIYMCGVLVGRVNTGLP